MINSPYENEYFVREDAERKRKLAQRIRRETQEAERQRLKALHWMCCPKCGLQMHEVTYRGMSVDVCFSCNGIFLEEAELAHIQKPESKGVMSGILNWFRPETRPETQPNLKTVASGLVADAKHA